MTDTLSRISRAKYVPILKAKAGELKALSLMDSDNLTPLLEVVDPAKAASDIPKSWPTTGRPVWIHLLNTDEGASDHPSEIRSFFASVHKKIQAVPVLTPLEEPDVLKAYSQLSAVEDHGAVIRVDVEDLIDASLNITQDIDTTLDALGLTYSNADLVVDAGLLSGAPTIQAAVTSQALNSLTSHDWRTIVVAFSAFPESVGAIAPKSAVTTIPRDDAAAFKVVAAGSHVELVYADYGIGVPTYGGISFSPIPNLKYATNKEWKIHRGETKKNPSPQIRNIAGDIVTAPYYSGISFSPADKMISEIASSSSGPGNATTHVAIAMCRHFHVVLDRLATLGEP